jgi:hypothetical protein
MVVALSESESNAFSVKISPESQTPIALEARQLAEYWNDVEAGTKANLIL